MKIKKTKKNKKKKVYYHYTGGLVSTDILHK
jgi:hypothetical protein